MLKTKEVQQVISDIKNECTKAGVSLELLPEKYIRIPGTTVRCAGIFCELYNGKTLLKVATKRPFKEWLATLLHEYGHMQQWRYEAKLWGSVALTLNELQRYMHMGLDIHDVSDIFDFWLSKKLDISLRELQRCIKKIVAVELDCEKKVIKLIDKYNLPINKVEYIKKANAHLYYYQFARKHRRWYGVKNEPSLVKEIWTRMPANFNLKYFNHMPPKYNKLYGKIYANKNVTR